MNKFFTADWHAGEAQSINTHSYLRQHPTDAMVEQWLKNAHEHVESEEDEIIFVGDIGITLSDDMTVLHALPKCKKTFVLGDKEYASKYFTLEQFKAMMAENFPEIVVCQNTKVKVRSNTFFVSHKPTDCFAQEMPSICGHIHGTWRTQKMNNGQPIINVGVDTWGGLVTENFIDHQFNAITKGYYDINCFPNLWQPGMEGHISPSSGK